MWLSKKKWLELERRVADLENKMQSQPEEIVHAIPIRLAEQMAKRGSTNPHRWKQ